MRFVLFVKDQNQVAFSSWFWKLTSEIIRDTKIKISSTSRSHKQFKRQMKSWRKCFQRIWLQGASILRIYVTDIIWKEKSTHLHRIMAKDRTSNFKEENTSGFQRTMKYQILCPPIKLSSIQNKLQYPVLSQPYTLLVEKQINTTFAQTNLLISIKNLKNCKSFSPIITLWGIYCNKNQYGYTQNLTLSIFIVNIWSNIWKIW